MKVSTKMQHWILYRAITFVSVALFVIAFHIIYVYIISKYYEYQGFAYHPQDSLSLATSITFSLLPSFVLPTKLRRPSAFVVWMLYLLAYIPIQMVLVYTELLSQQQMMPFQVTLLVSMMLLSIVPSWPWPPAPRPRMPGWVFWLVIGTYYVTAYAILLKTFGVQSIASSLSDVYRIRLEARNTLAGASRLVGYQLRWLSEAVNPFLMAVGLGEHKRWLFLLGALGQVLVFSFDATKSTVGSIALIIVVFLLFSRSLQIHAWRLIAAFIGVLGVTTAIDQMWRLPVLTGLLTRRLLAVPGLLTAIYLDYFSQHARFYWAHTIYTRWLNSNSLIYPEYTSPGFLIGDLYFHNPAGNANANLWADGYANAGLLGVIGVTLLLMIVLWLYDSVSKGKDIRIALLLVAMPTYAITNTSFLTALISHGWLLAILLMWLYQPRCQKDSGGSKWP